jgi:hypothetical protein
MFDLLYFIAINSHDINVLLHLRWHDRDICNVSPLLGITPRKEGVRIHWLCQTEKERYRNKRQDFYKNSVFANLLVDKRQPLADANKQQFIKTGR